jgi:putative SOS response-associated peptidase YedK
MCGRYVLKREDLEAMLKEFGIRSLEEFHSRYNISPSTIVPAVRARADGEREAVGLKWGLVPSWADDAAMGARLANARAEGIERKPAFRHAFRRKRCVVPATGFYEWQTIGRTKQPWFFARADGRPLLLAGLWESWRGREGTVLETCSLITTAPNELVQPLHDRMPVILSRADADLWLDPRVTDPEPLAPLLRACPAGEMKAVAVNPRVNSVAHDGPECLEPAPAESSPARNGEDSGSTSQLSLGF